MGKNDVLLLFALAYALGWLIGDSERAPHPVRWMEWLIRRPDLSIPGAAVRQPTCLVADEDGRGVKGAAESPINALSGETLTVTSDEAGR